jgi:Rieske Fe-S protein
LTVGWLTTQLSACTPIPVIKASDEKGTMTVPLSSFTEKNKMVIVRSGELEFDILVVKSANAYHALQMKCSHQDNPLTANASGLFCSAHGSTFDLEGNVTKEPALKPLKKYKTEWNASSVLIHTRS